MRKFLPHVFFFSKWDVKLISISDVFKVKCKKRNHCSFVILLVWSFHSEWQFTKIMLKTCLLPSTPLSGQQSGFRRLLQQITLGKKTKKTCNMSHKAAQTHRVGGFTSDRSEADALWLVIRTMLTAFPWQTLIACHSCHLQFGEYFFHQWIQTELLHDYFWPELSSAVHEIELREGWGGVGMKFQEAEEEEKGRTQ